MADATLVYHSEKVSPHELDAPAAAEQSSTSWRPIAEFFAGDVPHDVATIVVVDESLLAHAKRLRRLPEHVVIIALDARSRDVLGHQMDVSMVGVSDPTARANILRAACSIAGARLGIARLANRLTRTEHEFRELSRIGMALMHQHDRAALLDLIVDQGKQLTESDGGGLYLFETNASGKRDLVPAVYELDSLRSLGPSDIHFAFDETTVVGRAASTREPLVIDDIHRLPADSTFAGSNEFQRQYAYYAQSMLAVPMLDQDGEVLGVLCFINRKSNRSASVRTRADAERWVLPYSDRELRLARTLAGQAAISIENEGLHAHIEHLLESVVKAAVSAVDERDPATAGHSLRVAALTMALAEQVLRADHGRYRGVRFTAEQMRELRYAALLHDVGKVTVREDVLLKSHKLPELLWERVQARFDLIRRTLELEHAEQRARECSASAFARIDADLERQLRELDRLRDIVRHSNEPTILDAPAAAALTEIAKRTFLGVDGHPCPYLTTEELHYLRIPRGTLDERERAEIEAHVANTHRFLAQIPWTSDLKNMVSFAYGHHEKLNGSGYPLGLQDADIPLQTRMITIADIFDALTEADRPYKPAVSPERALDIIRADAKAGMLDLELVELLADSKVYQQVLEKDWHTL
jgi:HD-GYP domain-containing protein (c-di-GMP phosphodiesterase class II)